MTKRHPCRLSGLGLPAAGFILRLTVLVSSALLLAGCSAGGGETISPKNAEVPKMITVNQVDFATSSDSVWKIPQKGQRSPVNLALCLTNQSQKPLCFFLFNTLRISVSTPGGKALEYHFARDATRRDGWVSAAVSPGGTLRMERPAELTWMEDGRTLRLAGSDDFGGFWNIDGLEAGAYSVSLLYENHQTATTAPAEIWAGKAQTSDTTFRIE